MTRTSRLVVVLDLLLIVLPGTCAFLNVFQLIKMQPDQIRLALIPNGMMISWQTFGFLLTGSNSNTQPKVVYGLSETTLTETSTDGIWTVYDQRNPLYTSYFYNVKLLDLNPSTNYFYQILGSARTAASAIYSFQSAPAVDDSTSPVNITIVGDLGHDALLSLGDCRQTMNGLQMFVSTTSFYLHAGDLGYADDSLLEYELTYNGWQKDMAPVTRVRPYMTVPGNHEVTCSNVYPKLCIQNDRNFSAYLHRFRMPGPESGGFSNMWWSQDYGMVHVIGINTETDFPNSPSGSPLSSLFNGNFVDDFTQLAWLEADLQRANANRDLVPWIIVTGHRTWYGSNSIDNVILPDTFNCPACLAAFEPLFNKYNVDFYFAGHMHWYERICPQGVDCTSNPNVYTNPQGPIYIINGAGGNPEGISYLMPNTRPANSVKIISKAGFGQLRLLNRTDAIWNFFLSKNPSVPVDSVYITKNH